MCICKSSRTNKWFNILNLYLSTRVVDILLLIILAANPTTVNMINYQVKLSFYVTIVNERKKLLKKCGQKILLRLFMVRPITLKQLNVLTSIDSVVSVV